MRAARLLPDIDDLVIADVPTPVPQRGQVLVEVVGAGVCRSDLHIVDGAFAESVRRPVTAGHEISGVVAATGPAARIDIGTPVAVMVGWGCGTCHWCRHGHEQLCPAGREAGSTADGGFAEYVLVPDARFLIPLGTIPALDATPLGCAALSAYAGVRRVLPWLEAGSSVVIIGAGGLGQFAIHYARRLSDARVIAVDRRPTALDRARIAGAHQVVLDDPDAAHAIGELCGPLGARAVIDFVGSNESLRLSAAIAGPRGIIALLGLAGGSIPIGFTTLAPEATFTTVVAGTISDLTEVVRLGQTDLLDIPRYAYPLDRVNDALADLRAGRIDGRAVICPREQ
ncbi:MAG: alcohol dehydrogenase catalytic domain-containing protein [Actinomycetales bacterium]|nr:alcohol dehydrogenase catalytic domain-containing protein [Actinomycetales bacterium]